MRGVIFRFLNLEVTNFHPFVLWGLAAIWALLLAAAFSSLRSQIIPMAGKIVWFLVILFIPIGGLAAYAIWSLFSADWNFAKPLFQSRSQSIQAVADPGKRGNAN